MKKGDTRLTASSTKPSTPMSEFLHEVGRAFEQHYHRRITQHAEVLERDARDRIHTGTLTETWDDEEPFRT